MKLKKIRESGLTIIELLTAMAISLIVLSGISRVVVIMSANASSHQEQADIQETLIFASNRVGYALKHSFSSTCGDLVSLAKKDGLLLAVSNSGLDVGKGVVISSKKGTDIMGVSSDIIKSSLGSDKIKVGDFPLFRVGTISSSDVFSEKLKGAVENSDYFVVVDAGKKLSVESDKKTTRKVGPKFGGDIFLNKNDVFMISDCSKAVLFQVSNKGGYSNSLKLKEGQELGVDYDGGNSLLSKINFYAYYVGKDSDGKLGLRRFNLVSGRAISIANGIENMKIDVGLGNDLATQAYFRANTISKKSGSMGGLVEVSEKVVSAKIKYTATSNKESAKRDLTHVVALRNRINRD